MEYRFARPERRFFDSQTFETPDRGEIKVWLDDFTGRFYPPEPPMTHWRMCENNSFHYILRGHGFFGPRDGELRRLGPGEIFFIPPECLMTYYPDPADSWCYCGFSVRSAAFGEGFRRIGFDALRVLPPGERSERLGELIAFAVNERMQGSERVFLLPSLVLGVLSQLEEMADPPDSPPEEARSPVVARAIHYIEGHYGDPDFSVAGLCRYLHLSHSYFCRLFRRETGESAQHYLIGTRLRVARHLLAGGKYPVGEVGALCGYPDAARFSKIYKEKYGYAPGREKKRDL